ncbi:hypothetical protein KFE25_014330 [Diacronema lutheri]|uniref:C2 domain-containing protein n=1 Tax=Diacronema lutheri TaxID=2081491 RepID=A0A8J5XFA3_DIALT|nr:hypothetical protein KFE25_014330 [Diacronema lutheri]
MLPGPGPGGDPYDVRPLDLKADTYHVTVHVHECKDVHAESGAPRIDAMVEVDVHGEKRATRTHRQVSACTFDERYRYASAIETDADARATSIGLALYDVGGFGGLRRTLVGTFSVQLAWLAAQPKHELHRRWLGLERPGAPGVQALLRVSLSVSVGREAAPSRADDELSDDELIVTPAVRKKSHLVVVRVHRAVGLPKLDMFGTIDPYVEVSHGRELVRTSMVTNQRAPLWEQQLELPYVVPATSSAVVVMLWDGDMFGREPVGAVSIPFDEIPLQTADERERADDGGPPPSASARWHYFYGAPPLLGGRAARKMNTGRLPGIAFRGRVLLTIWAREQHHPVAQSFELPLGPPAQLAPKRTVDLLGNPRVVPNLVARTIRHDEARRNKLISPIEDEYLLRVWLVAGAYLPAGALSVEVEFGGARLTFGTHGSLSGEIVFARAREERRRLPDDPRQLPDVFVYLTIPLARTAGRSVRVAYVRYSTAQLLERTDKPWEKPVWTSLTEVPGSGAFGAGVDPGYLLLGTMLRRAREASELPFTPDLRHLWRNQARFELVFRVYLGKNLPAADDTGSLDPFLMLLCGGKKLRTHVRTQTSFPKWYSQYSLELLLPKDNVALGALALVQLWDQDRVGGDERAARATFELGSLKRSLDEEEVMEVDLFWETAGDLRATLLCSLTLVELRGYDISPPKQIELQGELCVVEVIAVCCRGLEPRIAGRLNQPYAVFDLGLGGDYTSLKRTTPSSAPDPSAPTYLEVIRLVERFPRDARLAPALTVRVIDPAMGVMVGTQIGQSALSLDGKLPWADERSRHHAKPTGLEQGLFWIEQLDAAIDAINALSEEGARQDGFFGGSGGGGGGGGSGSGGSSGGDGVVGKAGGGRAGRAPRFVISDETTVNELREQAVIRDPALATRVYTLSFGNRLKIADLTRDGVRVRALLPPSVSLDEAARELRIDIVRELTLGEEPLHVAGRQFLPSRDDRAPAGTAAAGPAAAARAAAADALLSSDEDEPAAFTATARLSAFSRFVGLGTAGARDVETGIAGGGGEGARGAAAGVGARGGAAGESRRRSVTFGRGTAAAGRLARGSAFRRLVGGGGQEGVGSVAQELDYLPRYMEGRRMLGAELEDERSVDFALRERLCDDLVLRRGELGAQLGSDGGRTAASASTRECGVFKGLVRVVEQDKYNASGLDQTLSIVDRLRTLQFGRPVTVRLYLLRILHLRPQDVGGTADPYVVVTLGSQSRGERGAHVPNALQADLHECYEFDAVMPGEASLLKIDVYDYSMLGADEYIGSTLIDLEERWTSAAWHEMARKPLELRSLRSAKSTLSLGQVELWVDIMPRAIARSVPIVQTRPPPVMAFELRVLIWATKYAPTGAGGKSDLFVKGVLDQQGAQAQAQETDVHYFVRNGKGQFNWRFVYLITLPAKEPRLVLEMCEWDLSSGGSVLARQTVPLRSLLRRAFRAREELIDQKASLFLDLGAPPGAYSRGWVHLDATDEALRADRKSRERRRKRKFPKVLATIEIVPAEVAATARPAGIGRSAPNMNPAMPEPKRPPSPDMVLLAFTSLWAEINAQTRINWILGALFIGFGIILAGSIVDNRAEIREVFAIIERFFNGEL